MSYETTKIYGATLNAYWLSEKKPIRKGYMLHDFMLYDTLENAKLQRVKTQCSSGIWKKEERRAE